MTAGTSDGTFGYGAVGYDFRIGKYDVTLTQYATFLNAVAATDTFGLYNTNLGTNLNIAGIARNGTSGSYTYSVIGNGDRPVTYVSWFDAARMANWMHNGQRNGAEDTSTTETGAYTLNGATSGIINRNPGAKYSVPGENEWYKAAYYDPTISGLNKYWKFATRSNSLSGTNPTTPGPSQVNYYAGVYAVTQSSAYDANQNYLTVVGAYSASGSYYATFDQSGNVWNWIDSVPSGGNRGIRGDSWHNDNIAYLQSSCRGQLVPTYEGDDIGFRLAASAQDLTFTSVSDVPLITNGYNATGKVVNLTLDFAPAPGTVLTLVNNTGSNPIVGNFSNVPNGGRIPLVYNGTTYLFTASYSAGDGNDLALILPGPGALDYSFGRAGTVVSRFEGKSSTIMCAKTQADGKIVVAGFLQQSVTNSDAVIARFLSDGSIDATFNQTGYAVIPTAFNDLAKDLAIQSDGKILMVVQSAKGIQDEFTVVRYSSNGTLDASFGSNGIVTTPMSSTSAFSNSVAIQNDGKIVVAGAAFQTGWDFALARYLPNGTLDTSFNGTGKVVTEFGSGVDYGLDVVIQSDGKIVVAGQSNNGSNDDFAVARYNPNGSPDLSFNGSGRVTTAVGSGNDIAFCLSLQPDNRILLGGTCDGAGGACALVRYNTNGDPDLSFGSLGKVVTDVGTGLDEVRGIVVLANGKILAAGRTEAQSGFLFSLQRYDYNGNLDSTFQRGGIVTTQVGSGSDFGRNIVVQDDGKILVVGSAASGTEYALARYFGDATWDVDAGFAPASDGGISSIAMQPDGKLVIGGEFTVMNGVPRNYVARLNADGTLDAGFNPDADYLVSSMAVQNDGKILIGGAFNSIGGVSHNYLARLNPSGTVDSSFNPDLDYVVSGIIVQPDGKVIIGGSFTSVGGVPRNRVARLLANGSLDSGFNPDLDGDVLSMVAQTDGKVLIGGNFTHVGAVVRNGVARLNANGTLDATFNPNADLDVMSIAVQADGKILLGGAFSTVGGVARNHLARVNADGSLDAGFNPDVDGNVTTIAASADGRVVIGGPFTVASGVPRHGVARLTSAGLLEAGFSPTPNDSVSCVTIQGDGKVVLGGSFTDLDGVARSRIARIAIDPATVSLTVPSLARVQWLRGGSGPEAVSVSFEVSTDGGVNWNALGQGTRISGGWEIAGLNLPSSGQVRARAAISGGQFNGSSGLVESVATFSFLSVNAEVLAVAVQPDGKTIFGGSFVSAGAAARNRIARFNPNATLDTGFNPDANNTVLSTAVQTDGKILIGGIFTTVGGLTRNSIARLNVDGTVETAFSPSVNAAVNSIGLQSDGKILIGGSFTSAGGSARNRCARLNATGTLDTAFNPNVNGTVNSVAIQADGKILLGGAFTAVGSARNGIARLNSTGSLDTTFNPNVTGGAVSCLAVQADGKILLSGSFTTVGGTTRNRIARVNADGTLDNTFNPNADNSITSMVVQADGRILIGGSFTTLGAISRSRLARLLADGTVDTTFSADTNNSVSCLALKADGQILAGGSFTSLAGAAISYLGVVSNDPATAVLSVTDYTRVQWLRGGSSPETQQVTFELSTDGGTVWSSLGAGTRISGGWEKTGLDLTGNGLVRARARTRGGQFGGSSGLVETVTSYTGFVPEIAVEQPASINVADGGSKNFGNVVLGGNTSLTFTILNSGLYPLTGLGITIDGVNSGDFSVTANPTAPVVGGGNTTFTVRFTPTVSGTRTATLHIADNDSDENPFDISLNGTGLVAGNVDPTFDPNVSGTWVSPTAVQPDGKIVIGGIFTSVGGQPRSNLARLNADGTLEDTSTFNPGTGANALVNGVALQADGKIVIVGGFSTVNGQPRNGIARLHANGLLEDTTTFNIGTGADSVVNCVAVQPDGKIVIAGSFITVNGQPRKGIARLNPNGEVEDAATFNIGSGSNGSVYALALQADGKILIGGYFTSVNGQSRNIARLLPNGAVEDAATFIPPSIYQQDVNAILVQPDGKILIGGYFTSVNSQPRNGIARLNADGTLESTATFNPGSGANEDVFALALQADGRILVAGRFTGFGGQSRAGLARLQPNGALEDTATFIIGNGSDNAIHGVTIAPDGAILITGQFQGMDTFLRNRIARLMNGTATQALSIPNSTRIQWSRGGTAPEVGQVTFELSTNGGSNWTSLGNCSRIAGGWELIGLNLPATGSIRARGRTNGGVYSSSSGIVEQIAPFTVTPNPDIAVEQPAGANIPDGGSVEFGSVVVANNSSLTFTIKNPGYANLTGLGITIDGTNSSEFTVTASPTAPVTSGGGSTTFAVKFMPGALGSRSAAIHIASNDPDESPFDITLNGIGTAAGFVDQAFGPNVLGDVVNTSVVQPDGKILIAGLFTSVGGQPRGGIARLNADGTVESSATFNPGSGANGQINCVAVQPDGKILLGGYFTTINGQTRNGLARLNADGTLESASTFNPGTGVGGVSVPGVFCIGLQADGKILIGGDFATVNGQARNMVARLNADGSVESTTSFNPGSGADGPVCTLQVQSDGKIIVGGAFATFNGQSRGYLARMGGNGSLDATFNPGANNVVRSLALQPDGRFIIGGDFTSVAGQARNRIARLNTDGSVENTTTFNAGTGANSAVYGIALQSDGKILLVGFFTGFNGQTRNRIVRLNTDGSLEGSGTFDPGTGSDNDVHTVALQADGKILIGGRFTSFGGTARSRIARLANDPATQTLVVPNSTLVQWNRAGSAPEVGWAGFDLSTDGGVNWTSLGRGIRTSSGWELVSLNLPGSGQIRVRGVTTGGLFNGSSGLVDQVLPFSVTPAPDITVEQPVGTNIPDGGGVSFGGAVVSTNSSRTFTIKNPGYVGLTGLGITIDGANSSDFTVTSSPATPVTSGGGSTTFTVRFSPGALGLRTAALHITSNDPDESPFDIALSGTGLTAGSLDLTFDPGSGANATVYAVAVQPDGRILIGGYFTNVGGQLRNNIARLNADGTLDETFNPSVNENVYSLAIQSDGKILIGGTFTQANGQTRNRIARLNPDGSLETTATFNPGTGANEQISHIAVQPDGKILIGGVFTQVNGQTRNRIARLNPDGSLESTTTFNPGTGANDRIASMAVQPDGKIVVAGNFTSINGQPRNCVARLHVDGSVESTATFNPGTGASGGEVINVARQPDGKILLAGHFSSVNGQTRSRIARLNADGTLEDTSTFNVGTDGVVYGLALQADGKIVMTGNFTSVNSQPRTYVARLYPNGSLEDTSLFNLGSGVNTGVYNAIYGAALDANGNILIGGIYDSVNGTARKSIARLVNDGAPQSLAIPDFSRVRWLRAGAAPEVGQVTFELSTNGGTTWTQLGQGTRFTGGWELAGLNLPATGQIRAKGRSAGGFLMSSSGVVEQTAAFSVTPSTDPDITIEQPVGNSITEGGSVFFGSAGIRSDTVRTFSVRNYSSANLTGLGITIDGANSSDFTVSSSPTTPVTSGGGSTTFTVKFSPGALGVRTAALHITSNDPDESPFDIALSGIGLTAGNLDLTFDPGSGANSTVYAVAVQPDGKILIGGFFTSVGGQLRNNIARLNADGTLDEAFNASVNENVYSMVIQSDGKILIGGTFTQANGQTRNRIARLNPDGSLETTATFNPGTGANEQISHIAVQPDGKILIGGVFTQVNGQTRNRIARLNPDGSLESSTTFNPGSGANDRIASMAVQPDGKIVVAGNFTSINGQARSCVARLHVDGSVEGTATFNSGTGASGGEVVNVVCQPDGKILLSGYFSSVNGQTRSRIARLNADGTLEDTSTFNVGTDFVVYGLALQADGKIVMTGNFTSVNGQPRTYVARLYPNGSLEDTSLFNLGSGVNTGVYNAIYGAALDANGNILIGGVFDSVNGTTRKNIARLVNDGATQSLSIPDFSRVRWLRAGAAPEVGQVTFELSTNGGTTWIPLGQGTRFTGGWELAGLNLPAIGQIRAKGRSGGGFLMSSSGLVEQIANYDISLLPEIAVEQPVGNNIADSGSLDFGSTVVAIGVSRIFTIKNIGYASLTGLGITIDGANSSDFTVTTSPTAPITSGGGSTTFTVQFSPGALGARTAALHISSNDPDENPFDILLSGTGIAAGSLDPAFNPNFDAAVSPIAQAIALQPDGKILVGGSFTTVGGQTRNNICRLLSDGSVESTATFNTGSNANGQVESIAVQADGKILIGGNFTTVDGQSRSRIARLNPNGSAESLATFNPGSGANDWVRCVALQPDGKILVSGSFTTFNGQARNRIARLNPDGSLESTASFNPGTGASDVIYSMAVQADGKILLGGNFTGIDGQTRRGIARLNADGSLENTTTFNPGTGATGGTYGVFCVVIQADGKILLAGDFTTLNGLSRNGIARLNSDGSVESSSTFNPGTGANGYVHGVALQADGKILLGGNFTTVNGQTRNRIARLNADGSLENTTVFDTGTGPNSMVAGVAIQANGNILIGGDFTSVNGQTRSRFARLVQGAAIQTLSAPNSMRAQWLRGGAGPELEQVSFELTTDGGTNWSLLGSGTRIPGGWELTALSLPPTGIIRARGRTSGGSINASSGIVEQLQTFVVIPIPEIAVEQPLGTEISNGSNYPFGAVNVGSSTSRTFTIRNKGYASLTGIGVTVDGPDAAMFSVTSSPAASLGNHSDSTTFTVRFDHFSSGIKTAVLHIGSNDFDENPFDITVTGRDPTTNANLSSLLLSEGTLVPAFSASTTSYTTNVPYGTAAITVSPIAADANATVRVNGNVVLSGTASNQVPLSIGNNTITTLVTAEDGITSRTYSTTVNRAVPVPGAANPAFGDPNVAGSYVTATAVQPDGKILIGGLFTGVGGQTVGSLSRLNADGSVESPATFNPGTGANGQVACIIVQDDGKIIIAGEFTSVNGQPRNYLARLNPDGTLESNATFNPGSGPNDAVKTAIIQPDGRILIGGHFTSVNGQTRNHIARLNTDGNLESSATFNPGTGANGNVYGMAVQVDGKIVIGGQFTSFDGQTRNCVARLNSNGNLENATTFNPGTGADQWVMCVAVQPDAKILIGGFFTTVSGQSRNRVARLNADGTLEATSSFNPGTGANNVVYSLTTQADGKILMGGEFTSVDGQARNRVARLLADGAVESTTTFNIGTGANDIVLGVTMQGDGGIILGGYFTTFNGSTRNKVAQLANGSTVQALSVPNASRVQWIRSGAVPEVEQVTFELSTNGGTSWAPIGTGSRISGGWEQTALNLPASGSIRARGRTRGGDLSCSSGIVEQIASFANPPMVATIAATNPTASGATLNASVTPNGSATVTFEYGPTVSYGSTTPVQNVAGGAVLNVQATVGGLAANSPYHCRVVATNAAGTVYGDDVLFSTAQDPPLTVTVNASSVTNTSATLIGAVNPKGRVTDVHFEYGLTTLYGSSTAIQTLPANNSAVDVFGPITGLIANATYHYRVVATSSGGTAAGADLTFQATTGGTPTAAPSVTTGGTTAITTASANLLGTVNPNGGFTNAYFEYGTTTGYGGVTTALGAGNGGIPVNLSASVTALTPGTLYHYRLVASNGIGTTQGSDATFTTLYLPPLAITNGSTALSTTSVRVNGAVRARNASTQVFFDYGTDGVNFPNSASATPSAITGDVDTAVSADLPNLLQGITYYYRVRAVSVGGTGTGVTSSFQVAILSGLLQQFPLAPSSAAGSAQVTLTPSGIATGWRFYGERQWRASGSIASNMTTGDREIEFRPVPGYIQPPRETVSVISGGTGIQIERAYYETETIGSGAVSVTLKPDSIAAGSVPVADRAQWRFLGDDNTQWRDSGTSVTGLPPGTYLVESKAVAGRSTPPTTSVLVANGQTSAPTITYFLADALTGTPPAVVPFSMVSTDQTKPYAYVGQIRSNVGTSSGFVVKPRVVATAGHVVWDDGTLSAVSDLQWLFQRDAGTYEPKPQIPRGFYIFDGYAAQRTLENTPGSSSPASQTLDVAAVYFVEDAGRSGYGGFLASDLNANEFLLSSAQKTLVGYPVDGIPALDQGRMHATSPANVLFTAAFGRTFTSTAIRSSGGMSGGPLCIQHSNGNYYPAAVYLGGTNQTVVRAIDSGVIDLFNRAETSGNGGDNQTGGGITHSSFTSIGTASQPGSLEVTIQPVAARNAGAGWRLKPDTSYRPSGNQLGGLNAGSYVLQLSTVSGFQVPTQQTVSINGGTLRQITFTYAAANSAPTISNVANQTIDEDTPTGAIALTVNDPDNATGSLVLTGTSSNITLVPNGNIDFGGSGANRSVTITPAANQSGTATITLTVSDGSLTDTDTFVVTVNPVNDAPTLTSITDYNVAVNSPITPLPVTIGDIETSASALTLSANSSNVTLVPISSIALGGSGANRTVTITPAANQLGSSTITVTVSDGALTTSRTFALTITGTAQETWRFTNFGTTADSNNSADSADPDGDGSPNRDEYAAGTDPNNAADVFKILTSTKDGTNFTVTVSGKVARTYVLERRDNLVSGPWTTIATVGPLAVAGPVSLTDAMPPQDSAFYRIRASTP